MTAAPPPEALAAFGAGGEPVRLAGGQGTTWRVGDLVLKPVGDPVAHAWVCDAQATWPARATVRVPEPVRSAAGAWQHAGWGAHRWLDGATARAGDDPDRFRRCVDDFHAAAAGLAPPAFLAERDDPWSFGERVAFEGAEPCGSTEVVRLIERATAALEPVGALSQVVHGDLGGNVLWTDGRPPAVIDWSPYFRPPGWALAVVAMDAVCWEGAAPSLLDQWADVPDWDQLLLRAVVYRLATRGRFETLGAERPGSDGYLAERGACVDLVIERLGRKASHG